MYGEDIDLSFRIQKEGFKNYYYHDVTILHFKGRSTQKDSIHYVNMFYKAMSIFVNKHYRNSRAGMYHFLIQCGIGIRAAIAALPKRLALTAGTTQKQKLVDKLPVIVIGDEASYQIVLKILGTVGTQIAERAVWYKGNPAAVFEASSFIDTRAGIAVFCEGPQSFQQIIEQAERLPVKHIQITIHAAGSKGIPGLTR